jgi:hypothetical protein
MKRLRHVSVVSVVAAALLGSTAAVAYWSAEGGGTGRGIAADAMTPVTISAAVAVASLVPTGAPSGDVAATIANPNPFGVRVRLLALDTSRGSAGLSSNAAGCELAFTTQDNGGAGWTIPPEASTDVLLADSMTMGVGAANSCQGRTFTVYLVGS